MILYYLLFCCSVFILLAWQCSKTGHVYNKDDFETALFVSFFPGFNIVCVVLIVCDFMDNLLKKKEE